MSLLFLILCDPASGPLQNRVDNPLLRAYCKGRDLRSSKVFTISRHHLQHEFLNRKAIFCQVAACMAWLRLIVAASSTLMPIWLQSNLFAFKLLPCSIATLLAKCNFEKQALFALLQIFPIRPELMVDMQLLKYITSPLQVIYDYWAGVLPFGVWDA